MPNRSPFYFTFYPKGFTTGNSTWLPVNENYLTLNLEAQRIAKRSPFKIFQELTAAQKNRCDQKRLLCADNCFWARLRFCQRTHWLFELPDYCEYGLWGHSGRRNASFSTNSTNWSCLFRNHGICVEHWVRKKIKDDALNTYLQPNIFLFAETIFH